MSRRILVADDEPIVHSVLDRYLGRYGYIVERAEDGHQALAAVETSVPDAVIADVRMPGLDGLQLLARIRERWPELPVLIISGHGDKVMEEQAFALGAVGFETKPLQLGDLVERLRRLFEADTQG